jgi:hypothetical protein
MIVEAITLKGLRRITKLLKRNAVDLSSMRHRAQHNQILEHAPVAEIAVTLTVQGLAATVHAQVPYIYYPADETGIGSADPLVEVLAVYASGAPLYGLMSDAQIETLEAHLLAQLQNRAKLTGASA